MKSTKEKSRLYYEKNKKKKLEVNERWRQRNLEKDKQAKFKYHLKNFFNISIEEYNQMITKQNGVCKLCKLPCPTGRNLAVDHCHKTGKVRGLLCVNCNKGIGLLKDDPYLLRSAASYLENEGESKIGRNRAETH